MKKNTLIKILSFVLPIAVIIILFLIQPLAGLAAVIALIGYGIYINMPAIYTFFGKADYAKGDLSKAAEKFKKACSRGSANPTTKIYYGYTLLKMGRIDDAYDVLNKVVQSQLPSDDIMYAKSNLALVIWKKGDVDGAVNMLEEVIKSYANTTVYGSLGYLLILKGDLDRALEFNLEAYEYNSTNTVILDNLGQTYYLRSEYEKAAGIYEKLMESKPSFPEAYYNYGLVLAALEEPERACETMQKAIDYKLTFLSTITMEEISDKLAELKQGLKAE